MQLNILQGTGEPRTAKNYLVQDVKSVKVEKVTDIKKTGCQSTNAPGSSPLRKQEFQDVNPELVS